MGGTVPRRTQSCAFFRLGCVGADRLRVNLRPDAERHADARVGMGTRLGARGAGGFDQTAGVGPSSGTRALDVAEDRLSEVVAVGTELRRGYGNRRRAVSTPTSVELATRSLSLDCGLLSRDFCQRIQLHGAVGRKPGLGCRNANGCFVFCARYGADGAALRVPGLDAVAQSLAAQFILRLVHRAVRLLHVRAADA